MLRMSYPAFVFRVLSKEGRQPEQLLKETGLTAEAFSSQEFLQDWPPLRQFFVNAIELTGDPHLGLRLAKKFEASFIGIPAYTAMNAATFEDSLEVLSRYFSLAFPAIEFTYPDLEADVRPDEFAIRLRPKLPLGEISYFASSSALICIDGLFKAILRTPTAVLRGEMSAERPMDWEQVEGLVHFPIGFESSDVRLCLSRSLLTRELPGADPINHACLLALCESLVERLQIETMPIGKVTSMLHESQNLKLSASEAAEALGWSERSLRRLLNQSGTTYRQLADEIRERRARGMLANTTLPIQTIAYDLGFESPSNFSRSFKRWTGESPSAFRLERTSKGEPGQK